MSPVHPEDVLPDDADYAEFGGVVARKGSVAAFVANAALIDRAVEDSEEYASLAAYLRLLAEPLRAIGVFDVFTVRSPRVAAVLRV